MNADGHKMGILKKFYIVEKSLDGKTWIPLAQTRMFTNKKEAAFIVRVQMAAQWGDVDKYQFRIVKSVIAVGG